MASASATLPRGWVKQEGQVYCSAEALNKDTNLSPLTTGLTIPITDTNPNPQPTSIQQLKCHLYHIQDRVDALSKPHAAAAEAVDEGKGEGDGDGEGDGEGEGEGEGENGAGDNGAGNGGNGGNGNDEAAGAGAKASISIKRGKATITKSDKTKIILEKGFCITYESKNTSGE